MMRTKTILIQAILTSREEMRMRYNSGEIAGPAVRHRYNERYLALGQVYRRRSDLGKAQNHFKYGIYRLKLVGKIPNLLTSGIEKLLETIEEEDLQILEQLIPHINSPDLRQQLRAEKQAA